MSAVRRTLWTVGHSNHTAEHFAELLTSQRIEVLVDVRSWPNSRYVEWANRDRLPELARSTGSRYLFLGDSLGGRPDDPDCYDADGHVLYGRAAAGAKFRAGIERLRVGINRYRVAIMCSEENPAHCHRRLLVCKVLLDGGVEVVHVRGSGDTETEQAPIDVTGGSLFEDEDLTWRSTRSVSRGPRPRTSLPA